MMRLIVPALKERYRVLLQLHEPIYSKYRLQMLLEVRTLDLRFFQVIPSCPYGIVHQVVGGKCNLFLLVHLIEQGTALNGVLGLHDTLDYRDIDTVCCSNSEGILHCLQRSDV